MTKIDIHQHLWTEPLLEALASRSELPFVRHERGLTVLFLSCERPYVIDLEAQSPDRRAGLVELDGLDRALLCLSSPLGIEALPREQALPLIDAYHEGAFSLGSPFEVWGAIPLDHAEVSDVDAVLDRGCVGLSLPAGALSDIDAVSQLGPLLARLDARGAPLLVHPGPGVGIARSFVHPSLGDPLWWPALTQYVAGMHDAWLAFHSTARQRHPELRVIFSMLAGLAPLHIERLVSRGGAVPTLTDPHTFYDTSSYGPKAVRMLAEIAGPEQLLYGSDRPMVEPSELGMPAGLDWEPVLRATSRAFATPAQVASP